MRMGNIEAIHREIHGKIMFFECRLYDKCGNPIMQKRFQTHQLAWAYGENWKLLNNGKYDIQNCEKR